MIFPCLKMIFPCMKMIFPCMRMLFSCMKMSIHARSFWGKFFTIFLNYILIDKWPVKKL